MARVLFINPLVQERQRLRKVRPVGLAYVLAAARDAAIPFDFYDMYIEHTGLDRLRSFLQGRAYDVVAFGCLATSLALARDVAGVVREQLPRATIVAGNTLATVAPGILLAHTEVDVAVVGEADHTIAELLGALLAGQPFQAIRGLAWLADGRLERSPARPPIQPLDALSFPEWGYFDSTRYNEGHVGLDLRTGFRPYPISSARGCPNRCTFCYHAFQGMPYRRHSIGRIVTEIARLRNEYGATFVGFSDELSFASTRRLEQLVDAMEQLPFRVGWSIVVMGDQFRRYDLPLLRRMRDLGCTNICFSVESADPAILRAMGKRSDVDRYAEHVEALHESGLTFGISCIVGHPLETVDSLEATFSFCERYGLVPGVGFLQPLPGTPIYDWARREGHIPDEVEYLLTAGDREVLRVNLTSIPSDELADLVVARVEALARRHDLVDQSQFLQFLGEYDWHRPGGP